MCCRTIPSAEEGTSIFKEGRGSLGDKGSLGVIGHCCIANPRIVPHQSTSGSHSFLVNVFTFTKEIETEFDSFQNATTLRLECGILVVHLLKISFFIMSSRKFPGFSYYSLTQYSRIAACHNLFLSLSFFI